MYSMGMLYVMGGLLLIVIVLYALFSSAPQPTYQPKPKPQPPEVPEKYRKHFRTMPPNYWETPDRKVYWIQDGQTICYDMAEHERHAEEYERILALHREQQRIDHLAYEAKK